MATSYFTQLQWQGLSPWEGQQMATACWDNTGGGWVAGVALQVGCTPSGVLVAYRNVPPGFSGTTPVNPTDCAVLQFSTPGTNRLCNVVVPGRPSWYQSDQETVNPFDPGVAAVIAALLAGGLCNPSGVPVSGFVGGYRAGNTHPTPWPK